MDGFWENIGGLGMLSDLGLSSRGRHQKLHSAAHGRSSFSRFLTCKCGSGVEGLGL